MRSAGGNKAGLLGWKKEDREKGDERILRRGDFVGKILADKDGLDLKRQTRISLDVLSKKIASCFEIEEADLKS